MLKKQIVFAVVIIVIIVSVVTVLLMMPEKIVGCGLKDSICPPGCTYAYDADCMHSTVTSMGEVKRCLSDSDCVEVNAICDNERCNFDDVACSTECACKVSINKDYKSVFESANVPCTSSGITVCAACPENTTNVCISGECRTII
ncbi:MAG: hypothetical protein V1839_02025 [archaeon]